MKNFKLNSITLTLAGVLFTTILLLSSCSKVDQLDINETETNAEISKYLKGEYIVLPAGYEDEKEIITYLQNATKELADKLVENHRIKEFLYKEDLYIEVIATLTKGEHLADVDLSSFLNSKQLEALGNFSANDNIVSRRSCTSVSSGSTCYTKCCTYYPIHPADCDTYRFC